jgi:large subunit ribosomal protein L9
MGDVVKVRDGYARNYLLPKKKALRATKDNLACFERERAQLEAHNLEQKKEAEAVAGKLEGKSFVVIRQASEAGQLYGSVSTRDIADLVTEGGFTILRTQVQLDRPIKTLGQHPVRLQLHPEVSVSIAINVARTQEEAERMERGEKVTARHDDEDKETMDAADTAEESADAAAIEESA